MQLDRTPKKRDKKTAQPARKLRLNSNQRDILISALLCVGIVFGTFFWVQNSETPRALDRRVTVVANNVADHQKQIISAMIAQLSERVSSLAGSELIAEILEKGDQSLLDRHEQLLRKTFPDAVDSKLIRLGEQGTADAGSDIQRLRNNIEIDMLRKAIETRGLVIEAYQEGTQWLISFTQLINTKGAIFVTFPASHLAGILRNIAGTSVQNELVQTYKSHREVVIKAGDHRYAEYMKSHSLPVPGWSLKVYPTETLIQNLETDDTMLWLVCMICIALITGSHAIFFMRSLGGTAPVKTGAPQPVAAKEQPAPVSLEDKVAQKLAAHRQKIAEQGEEFTSLDVSHPPLPEREAETDSEADQTSEETDTAGADNAPPLECFRAYDIRGLADSQLTDENCRAIARAVAAEGLARGQRKILIGRDGRLSSQRIRDAVATGLLESGMDVVDLGLVATPMLQFASWELNVGNTLMITGSHNPGNYNGMKISFEFRSLSEEDIQTLRRRIIDADFCDGSGELQTESIEQRYIDRICGDVVVAQTLKVVIDAGNGATSNIVIPLFEELGCEVVPLHCDIDGSFPNHPPDPTVEENLAELRQRVIDEQADIGIAFDGDGDRVAVVSAAGICPRADRLLMILADDMVSRNPGCEILFDIKCSRLLPELILARGGKPTMWKCGHSFMKRKMFESGALLGGEYSGHIFFKERWYGFDDGMYAAARLLESLSLSGSTLDEELSAQPQMCSTPEISIPVAEERKFSIVAEFAARQQFENANIVDIDGFRLETRGGWGLLRASNTGPALSLRFEAESDAALAALRSGFSEVLAGIDPALADGL